MISLTTITRQDGIRSKLFNFKDLLEINFKKIFKDHIQKIETNK